MQSKSCLLYTAKQVPPLRQGFSSHGFCNEIINKWLIMSIYFSLRYTIFDNIVDRHFCHRKTFQDYILEHF
jgi:hypothetical protein